MANLVKDGIRYVFSIHQHIEFDTVLQVIHYTFPLFPVFEVSSLKTYSTEHRLTLIPEFTHGDRGVILFE